jgi:cell division protein FtsW (lipid II flippase)
MRKTISFLVFWFALFASGMFCDTAFYNDTPFKIFIIQLIVCVIVMIMSLIIGRLYEDYEEDST